LGQLIQQRKADTPIVTIRNGVDANRFRPLPKDNRILVASRLVELKGVQDVIDAVSRMNIAGWRLDIVGDGPYRAALERHASACHLGPHTTFHGWLDHNSNELRDLYGKARVFVTASYLENLSMSLLEALSARCWIVASDVGGTSEIVGASSLFPAGSVDALRTRLATVMEAALRDSGPPLHRDWHWNNVIVQYEALYLQ
jgi:glycosyltransferase involved in cell wall biosynthesis